MIWHVNTTMEYFFFKYQESKKCNLYSVSNKNMPGTRERLRKGLKILIEGQLTDGVVRLIKNDKIVILNCIL